LGVKELIEYDVINDSYTGWTWTYTISNTKNASQVPLMEMSNCISTSRVKLNYFPLLRILLIPRQVSKS